MNAMDSISLYCVWPCGRPFQFHFHCSTHTQYTYIRTHRVRNMCNVYRILSLLLLLLLNVVFSSLFEKIIRCLRILMHTCLCVYGCVCRLWFCMWYNLTILLLFCLSWLCLCVRVCFRYRLPSFICVCVRFFVFHSFCSSSLHCLLCRFINFKTLPSINMN